MSFDWKIKLPENSKDLGLWKVVGHDEHNAKWEKLSN